METRHQELTEIMDRCASGRVSALEARQEVMRLFVEFDQIWQAKLQQAQPILRQLAEAVVEAHNSKCHFIPECDDDIAQGGCDLCERGKCQCPACQAAKDVPKDA